MRRLRRKALVVVLLCCLGLTCAGDPLSLILASEAGLAEGLPPLEKGLETSSEPAPDSGPRRYGIGADSHILVRACVLIPRCH